MNEKHTPGPWSVDGGGIRALVRGSDLTIVATRHRLPAATHEANARLIAAAPALAESLEPDALEAIADEIDGFEHGARAKSLRGIAKRQRAAIAKAITDGSQ